MDNKDGSIILRSK